MPALLTSTSSLPKCRVVATTTAAQLSSFVTSRGSNRAEAPIASATCRPSCVGDHHFGAFPHEHARRGCPHARCRAGDDGDLARKSHDRLSFCFHRRTVSQLLGSAQRSSGPSPNHVSSCDSRF